MDKGTGRSACATQVMKTVAALLHPSIQSAAISLFQNASCHIEIREDLNNAGHLDAALIFGGDGTVHRFLPQLQKLKIPALVVPKGSGNDFAKTLGITSPRVALGAWKEFCKTGKNVREIDLGILQTDESEVPFCCVAGAGLDSVANARANRMPSWLRGSAGYLVAALQSLPAFRPVSFSITAGQREIQRSGFLLAVGNAHRYGHGIKIAPRAVLDDGLLDVCVVGAMNKLKLLAAIPTVFFGAHLGIREVEYCQAAEIRIDSDPALEIYADGEFACSTPAAIRLLPRALRVIIPARGTVEIE
jgi:diacylglycerol kinase (ATP)